MKCTLMHKNIPVAELLIAKSSSYITRIENVYAPEHIPVGVPMRHGHFDRNDLNQWWLGRSIPATRPGIKDALGAMNLNDSKQLLTKCYGLSLSDQYWVCPKDSGLRWEDVNFFTNQFSTDIGDILFTGEKKPGHLDFSSPDNTSDGFLQKRWKIIDGTRCLIKGGSGPFLQQPLNEVIASRLMEELNIPHVDYSVTWDDNKPYSICKDFVTPDTELVSAWHMMAMQKQDNSTNTYQHLLKCCDALGVPDITPLLDQMIVLDYIIANEDRHFNNFGVLRNAETLEYSGMAPIFDSGNSLHYNDPTNLITTDKDDYCMPFYKRYSQQLGLVKSFSWIEFRNLENASNIIADTFAPAIRHGRMDEARANAIMKATGNRIHSLEQLAMDRHSMFSIPDSAGYSPFSEIMSGIDEINDAISALDGPKAEGRITAGHDAEQDGPEIAPAVNEESHTL